jgi:hypothetical protein
MAFLTYTTLSPPLSGTTPPYLYPGSFVRDLVGEGVIKLSWGIVVVAHTAEAFYTAKLVKKHRTPFGVGVSSRLPLLHVRSLIVIVRPCTFWEPSCLASLAGWS